jgi:hypothetical protein
MGTLPYLCTQRSPNHNTDLVPIIHEVLILPEVREGKEEDLEKFALDLAECKSCATITDKLLQNTLMLTDRSWCQTCGTLFLGSLIIRMQSTYECHHLLWPSKSVIPSQAAYTYVYSESSWTELVEGCVREGGLLTLAFPTL